MRRDAISSAKKPQFGKETIQELDPEFPELVLNCQKSATKYDDVELLGK